MLNTYSVYMHICPNQKRYIGITKLKPSIRWGKNGTGYDGQLFYNAVKKYGWDNIKHLILYENLDKEKAEELEIFLIKKYKSNCKEYGYNVEKGGYTHSHTVETKMKMSATRKGRNLSEQHKKALSKARRGIEFTNEHRKKLSEAKKGKHLTQEQKNKISLGCKNKGTKAVIQLTVDGVEIKRYQSEKEAMKHISPKAKGGGNIGECCKGNRNTAYGYKWRYANE